MRQFILIMICILLQVIHVHAGSKDITWKWDYSEADDIFIDLLGKAATGFMETNTPNCYGGKLVVKLPEGLHLQYKLFRQKLLILHLILKRLKANSEKV